MTAHMPEVKSFNVIKGFLNLCSVGRLLGRPFRRNRSRRSVSGRLLRRAATVMIEYSSPNTNKPLHLGHIRNNLLGYSGGADTARPSAITSSRSTW
ncbi:MAG: arginine--tRNA ligase [Alistipes shahii]